MISPTNLERISDISSGLEQTPAALVTSGLTCRASVVVIEVERESYNANSYRGSSARKIVFGMLN
jgi:hypothetical protein